LEKGAKDMQQLITTSFSQQAARTPQRMALSDPGAKMSYAELEQRSNQLAHYLQTRGIKPGKIVALYLERSAEMVVAILAVLKAGGAYLPIDPQYPPARIEFMIGDARPSLTITQQSIAGQLPDPAVLLIDTPPADLAAQPTTPPDVEIATTDPAYIIYTSGSTGTPKGVLVTHHNVVRLLTATDPWFRFAESDVWTLFHSYAFDFSVWEIWGALLHGGRLVIVPFAISRDPHRFYELLVAEQVTVLNQTPSAFRQLMQAEARMADPDALALQYVIFGGEALDIPGLAPWFARHGDQKPQLVNMYGITETTVHVTYRPVTAVDAQNKVGSLIGKPIPDLQIYLLDDARQLVADGEIGEIYVGGDGVAAGYLNRPQLTAARFIPREQLPALPGDDVGARGLVYRSGDLARRTPEGDLEYLGRIDHQVKIRGFRIELGEIETRLGEHPAVREQLVTAVEAPAGTQLVAYLVLNEQVTPAELRRHLTQNLPDYMVPAVFLPIEKFSLTTNGKIDRRALPPVAEARPLLTVPYQPPRTPLERELTAVWEAALGRRPVGVQDHFLEFGGDSIRAMMLVDQAAARGIHFTVQQLFAYPTIAQLTAVIDENTPTIAAAPPSMPTDWRAHLSAAEQVRFADGYPLSPMQQGMLFHTLADPDANVYFLQLQFEILGLIDRERFQTAWQKVIARHDILRTLFRWQGGAAPIQLVLREFQPDWTYLDWRGLDEQEQAARFTRFLTEDFARGFQLDQAPPFRLALCRLEEDAYRFVLTISHIITDGWSEQKLYAEVFALYDELSGGEPVQLSPPRPYREYIDWLAGQDSASLADFWRRELAGFETSTVLPITKNVDTQHSMALDQLFLSLPTSLRERLDHLTEAAHLMSSSVFQAAWALLLSRYTGSDDVLFGTSVTGRMPTLPAATRDRRLADQHAACARALRPTGVGA
jgi:amino acid adenylation domain-containing protein